MSNQNYKKLAELGFKVSNRGFTYILDAVEIINSQEEFPKMTWMYHVIATKNNTTGSHVERAIRHAVGTYYETARNIPFWLKPVEGCRKLENKEFIVRVSNYFDEIEANKDFEESTKENNYMRTKDVLFKFNDVAVLLQYLYIGENHSISYNNGVAILTLRMTDGLSIMCKNNNFPDLPESNFTCEMTPSYIMDIIEVLKEEPPVEFPETFANRWDEIKTITQANLGLNMPRR